MTTNLWIEEVNAELSLHNSVSPAKVEPCQRAFSERGHVGRNHEQKQVEDRPPLPNEQKQCWTF